MKPAGHLFLEFLAVVELCVPIFICFLDLIHSNGMVILLASFIFVVV